MEFDLKFELKSKRLNAVLDALSRKVAQGYVTALTTKEKILPRIKEESTKDQSCVQLMQQVVNGVTRKF